MAEARLLPSQGLTEAPVAVAGFTEPSLVFALGTTTELTGADRAAKAIEEARPAVVEARQEAAFQQALRNLGVQAREVAVIDGLNYSKGDPVRLRVYVNASSREREAGP